VIRSLLAASLFAIASFALLSPADGQPAQPKKSQKKKAKVDPKAYRPDAATLQQIKDRTEELRKAVAALKDKKIPDDVLIEVEIFLKGAENIVRFEEWLHRDSVKWTLTTLDRGLERAKQAADGKAPWRDEIGRWIARAYRSKVDGSIQPYAVLLPHEYGKDPKKQWRLDIVLHGRDSSLTEAKFLATHDRTREAPKDLGYVQLEPYGRGNNAYRWAGETDVFEAMNEFRSLGSIDSIRVVLRGFSMGGAGTWHIGLHHPSVFCVMGPGAGFTTTHGYVGNLPAMLPEYQEKCLHIYDAVDYVENAFDIPIVAYSGEIDAQKKAADNIENLLKKFKEPVRFTHLIAPGLAHQMPPEWQAKAEVEYRKYSDKGRDPSPDRIRFVTYTPSYGVCAWLAVHALERTYEKTVVDATRKGDSFTITTANVRRIILRRYDDKKSPRVAIDGQTVDLNRLTDDEFPVVTLEKEEGKWLLVSVAEGREKVKNRPIKDGYCSGPIDDAFRNNFRVVTSTGPGWHPGISEFANTAVEQFAATWDRYFRGKLPRILPRSYDPDSDANLVLFGDPESNSLIAKVLPKLPITWTRDKLVVNGVEYDPKTHVPVLIYPNPLTENRSYVVINSGHTFKEADLKGTNALLFPRLGDWAVIKPTPTQADPAAYEVVAAGLFDENWQFEKKQ
jgi:hypothetical protein